MLIGLYVGGGGLLGVFGVSAWLCIELAVDTSLYMIQTLWWLNINLCKYFEPHYHEWTCHVSLDIIALVQRTTRLVLICANRFRKSPNPNFRQGAWSMPVSFGVLKGLDCYCLAGYLGEGPLIRKVTGDLEPLLEVLKRVLSRHPSRGKPIGLNF